MAGSIINTLRYGNKKTKRMLYVLIFLGVFALLLGGFAFILGNVVLGVLAAVVLFTDSFILANTNFSKMSMEEDEKQKRMPSSAHHKKQGHQKVERKEKEERPEKKEKKEKKEKREKNEEDGQEKPGALEWIFSDPKEEENKEEKEEDSVKDPAGNPEEVPEVNPLRQYNGKKMKQIFVAYKVRREHVPIMIDYCQAERISQCPAYLWKDSEFLYFLLLEEEARMVKCPISEVDGIHIWRGITARPSMEYVSMQEATMVSKVFMPYLPTYYRTDTESSRVEHKKNRYSLAPGIWCTPASVKNMLKILPSEFYLEEEKINSDDYSIYFRRIYICQILFRDAVITASEYKQKVQEILAALASADIADSVFHSYLVQIVMGNLIPQEFADFAIAKRTKKKQRT